MLFCGIKLCIEIVLHWEKQLMKTLLAIINHADDSKPFIRHVAGLALDLKARVDFLYIQHTGNYPFGTPYSSGTAMAQVQQNLESLAASSAEVLSGHLQEVKKDLKEYPDMEEVKGMVGVPAAIAEEYLAKGKADMLVLVGQQNESFWTQSTSNLEIINQVSCPVWVIPHTTVYMAFRKVLYATDYKKEDIEGLKQVIELLDPFVPEIEALHVTDSLDFKETVQKTGFAELLRKKTGYEQLSVNALEAVSEGDIGWLLNEYALDMHADLLVLIKKNRSIFERIFTKDPADKVVDKSMLPVLVLHQ